MSRQDVHVVGDQEAFGGTWRQHTYPEEDFNPGYMILGRELMAKQGTHAPWTAPNDYYIQREELPAIDLDEPALRYS